jgi:hypothetical protein
MSAQFPPPTGAPVEPAAPTGGTPKVIVWAFILSLAGFLILTALAAVAMVLTNWKRVNATGKGKGLAIAALVISGLWLVIMVFAVLSPPDQSADSAGTEVAENSEGVDPVGTIEVDEVVPQADPFDVFLVEGDLAESGVCERYEEVFVTFRDRIEKRQAVIGNKKRDERQAAKFISDKSWTSQSIMPEISEALDEAARTSLREVQMGQFAGEATDRYLRASLTACGQDLGALRRESTDLDSKVANLRALAANVPWYPKGFNLFNLEGNVAWRWTNDRCSTSFTYCWTMQVISETGCPTGLYAEVNILQGDTIVGFSNDLLGSLPPGQKAKLEFRDFGGSGQKTARLTTFNCY